MQNFMIPSPAILWANLLGHFTADNNSNVDAGLSNTGLRVNLGQTFIARIICYILVGAVAQWLLHWGRNQKVNQASPEFGFHRGGTHHCRISLSKTFAST